MNILVVRLSAIGDCTLVLPAVRALLNHAPEATVHWLIDHTAHALLQDCQHERLVFHPIDKPKRIADLFRLRRYFKRQLNGGRFDAVLAMQANTRVNLLYPVLPSRRTIGFDKTRARELQWLVTDERIAFANEHLHDSFMRFVRQWLDRPDLNASRDDFALTIGAQAKEQVNGLALPERFVAINPAASKRERTWSSERYADIIGYIAKVHQLPVVLTGGPSALDVSIGEAIMARCQALCLPSGQPAVRSLIGETSLQGLAGVLERAACCIAPDTGPLHIANAMGTKVIGLYAVVSSQLSGPYHRREFTVDAYEAAVATCLQKNADELAWNTRVHDPRAMACVSLEAVKERLDRALGGSIV